MSVQHKMWRTAVEGVGSRVLLSLLISSVGVGVLDTTGFAELGGTKHVQSVDEEGRSDSSKDVAMVMC